MAPRVFNLAGIRRAVFDQADWAPSQSTEAVKRVDEFIDRAYMRLSQDAPFLFFEDEIRWAVHPDQTPGLATDMLRVADIGGTPDAWTLETELAVGTADALVWETDRKWDARYLLLQVPNPTPTTVPNEYHLIRIREVFTANVAGTDHIHITLERPWRNLTDTGITYRVVSDEFTLPDDLIELRNVSLMEEETSYPYPLAVIGQTQAEFATFPNNNRIQTAGPPRAVYRREHQSFLDAPTKVPAVTLNNQTTWGPPEPTGSFEYLITYIWGKQEIWAHGQGPKTQATASPLDTRFEPYYESGPSPVSAEIAVEATDTVNVAMPDIDFMLGFGDASTPRYHRAGVKKRIYRRRVTSDAAAIESPNKFFLLDEVDGHVTTYLDNGTVTPDYKRPFRSIHGYQTFRLYPRPEKRYELVLRAIKRPHPLYDETDMPRIHRDGIDCLILRAMQYLYESMGNAAMARLAKEDYDLALFALAKRHGDLRPSTRLRRRRPARVRSRWTWRRDLAGVVKNS